MPENGPQNMTDPISARCNSEQLEEMRSTLHMCIEALRNHSTAWLTVSPLLEQPYPDDPRWTPWTRWGKRACERGEIARERAMRTLGL